MVTPAKTIVSSRVLAHVKQKCICVYKDKPLGWTETFVRGPVEQLHQYSAFYFGCRAGQGLPLLGRPRWVIREQDTHGRCKELLFKLGFLPSSVVAAVRRFAPVLIHAHSAGDGRRVVRLAQTLQVPLITTCHGCDVLSRHISNLCELQYHLQKRAFLQGGTYFLAVSHYLYNAMLQQGFPKERTRLHYTGIDLNYFQPRRQMPSQKIVLFVGRLVEKKGCEYLLRAMVRVQATHPEARPVIVGDGPLRQSLEALARQLQLKDCRFLYKQTPAEVRAWMQQARLLCVPSVVAADGDAETFGMVFAEAQASGVPVVSFASGGIPEVVAHEKTGLLARERDVDELTYQLTRLLTDDKLWLRLAQAAPQYIAQKFDIRVQTARLEEFYTEVLTETQSRVCWAARNRG